MDADRFDAISRVLGTQSRRRGMLRAAAGGALGLVGLAAASDLALARPCDRDSDCRRNDVCDRRNNQCVECLNDRDCTRGQRCTNRNRCR